MVKVMDQLSTTFAALADPTRRAILSRLAGGETSVTDLARPFDMTLPAISKHLKVLEKAQLIARSRAAQWRPCRLQAQPLKNAAAWIDEYRRFWEESLDRLEVYLSELQEKEKNHGISKPCKNRKKRINARSHTRVQRSA
jgi:DNA-binding transcriptional ArsR family regulator